MEAKEFIKTAKEKLLELFSERMAGVAILLEEIEFESDGGCKVTLSFFEENKEKNIFEIPGLKSNYYKVYKVVYLDSRGEVKKIMNHD